VLARASLAERNLTPDVDINVIANQLADFIYGVLKTYPDQCFISKQFEPGINQGITLPDSVLELYTLDFLLKV
jgi:hypothetical protein